MRVVRIRTRFFVFLFILGHIYERLVEKKAKNDFNKLELKWLNLSQTVLSLTVNKENKNMVSCLIIMKGTYINYN